MNLCGNPAYDTMRDPSPQWRSMPGENGPSASDPLEDWDGADYEQPDDPDDDMQEVYEDALAADLQALVAGDLDPEEFHEEHSPTRFRSFADAGVLTRDKGFRFDWHGQTVYITIQVQ